MTPLSSRTKTSSSSSKIPDDRGLATIVDDDVAPPTESTFSITTLDAIKLEGNAGESTTFSFEVARTGDLSEVASVSWSVTGIGSEAVRPADAADFDGFLLPSGVVTFPANENSVILDITVAGDDEVESAGLAEGFRVVLTELNDISILSSADGFIQDDDASNENPSSLVFNEIVDADGKTATQVEAASRLAGAAYAPEKNYNINPEKEGWTKLQSNQFIDETIAISDGRQTKELSIAGLKFTSVADVYTGNLEGENTIALAFRGSDEGFFGSDTPIKEILLQVGSWDKYLAKHEDLIEEIKKIAASDDQIKKVLITGHSLGGILAEGAVNDEVWNDAKVAEKTEVVTFASPGYPGKETNTSVKIVNFAHNDDIVANLDDPVLVNSLKLLLPSIIATNPEFTTFAPYIYGKLNELDNLNREGEDINIEKANVIEILFEEHFYENYKNTIEILTNNINAEIKSTENVKIPEDFDEWFFGNKFGEYVVGSDQRDILSGLLGTEAFFGEQENDTVLAGPGADLVLGGSGDDTLVGGTGDDAIYGENGVDTIAGGLGNDSLFGGTESDSLEGGFGNDLLRGGASNDKLAGGSGDDILFGDNGADLLLGDGGRDTLNGGAGEDLLVGGRGDDTIDGGSGVDTASFSGKRDDYRVSFVNGELLVKDSTVLIGDGLDTLSNINILKFEDQEIDLKTGTSQSDTLSGNTDNVLLVGGAGDDLLISGRGVDTMTGGGGADIFRAERQDFNNDVITDFSPLDKIVNTGVRFFQEALDVLKGSAILEIDIDGDGQSNSTLTLLGDFDGEFIVTPSAEDEDPETTIRFEPNDSSSTQPPVLPELAEHQPVDSDTINGVDQDRLTGDGFTEFALAFVSEGAAYNNMLGAYTIEDDGTIHDPEILFSNVNSDMFDPNAPTVNDGAGPLSAGDSISLGVIAEGEALGFFLVQDGFSLNGELDGELDFVNPETGQAANVNDTLSPDLLLTDDHGNVDEILGEIFHTTDANPTDGVNPLNSGSQVQALSGTDPKTGEYVIAFEDLVRGLPGADNDFNDVVVTVS